MSPHVVPEVTRESRDMSYYRAPSLFQPHRCRDAIRDAHSGKIPPMVAAFVGITTLPVSLFIAPMGFDHVFIDWAHSNCNTETMTQVSSVLSSRSGWSCRWCTTFPLPARENQSLGSGKLFRPADDAADIPVFPAMTTQRLPTLLTPEPL